MTDVTETEGPAAPVKAEPGLNQKGMITVPKLSQLDTPGTGLSSRCLQGVSDQTDEGHCFRDPPPKKKQRREGLGLRPPLSGH